MQSPQAETQYVLKGAKMVPQTLMKVLDVEVSPPYSSHTPASALLNFCMTVCGMASQFFTYSSIDVTQVTANFHC